MPSSVVNTKPITRPKLLIVEDESIIALDLQMRLGDMGYEVVSVASDPDSAVRLAQEKGPDIVLMDIALEERTDGIAAAQVIKERYGLSIIFVTSHSDISTIEHAKIIEPEGYILKPFSDGALRAALEVCWYRRLRQIDQIANFQVSPPQRGEQLEAGAASLDFDTKEFLRLLAPFTELSEASLDMLAQTSKKQIFAAREIIYLEEQDDADPLVIYAGRVALGKSSEDGKELTVDLLLPGESFGLSFALDRFPLKVSARAQVNSVAIFLARRVLRELIEKDPKIERSLRKELEVRLQAAHELARTMAYDRVERRIADTLFKLTQRYGPALSGQDEVLLELTRQELANLSGITIETAIRITKDMEASGILDLKKRGRIAVKDLEALQKYGAP
ncbi:MAG: hypothetical protein DCC75_07660 [Proteobacteria bacterium]|nr:MAG: hypothetical protein DCC75_07660 [Pseudomonadota bacterium]